MYYVFICITIILFYKTTRPNHTRIIEKYLNYIEKCVIEPNKWGVLIIPGPQITRFTKFSIFLFTHPCVNDCCNLNNSDIISKVQGRTQDL